MKYEIRDKENQAQGTVEFIGGSYKILGEHTPEFEALVREAWDKGVDAELCVFDEVAHTHTIVRGRILGGEKNFELSFKKHMEGLGYSVIDTHPELDQAIRRIISSLNFSEDEKAKLVEKIPRMTYLEKTLLIEADAAK